MQLNFSCKLVMHYLCIIGKQKCFFTVDNSNTSSHFLVFFILAVRIKEYANFEKESYDFTFCVSQLKNTQGKSREKEPKY